MIHLLLFAIVLCITITCAGYRNSAISKKICAIKEQFVSSEIDLLDFRLKKLEFENIMITNIVLAVLAPAIITFLIVYYPILIGMVILASIIGIITGLYYLGGFIFKTISNPE